MMTLVTPQMHRATYQVSPTDSVEVPVYYVTRDEEVDFFMRWAKQRQAVAADIETDGKSPDGLRWRSKKIATIQIGSPYPKLGPKSGPAPDPTDPFYGPGAFTFCVRSLSDKAMRRVLSVLEREDVVVLGQNLGFELIWLQYKYGLYIPNPACCQVAELTLRAGLFPIKKGANEETGGGNRIAYGDTSMKKLCQRHLGIEIEKGDDIRLSFWVTPAGALNERQLNYSAGDVVYPFYIAASQKPEILDRGLRSILTNVEFPLMPIIVDTQIHGIGFDRDAWMQLYQEQLTAAAAAKARLDELFTPQTLQSDMFGQAGDTVRPTIGVRKGKGSVAKEINYNAPAQVQRAILSYCKRINWYVEPIISEDRLLELKRLFGKEWMGRKAERGEKVTVEDVPDWVLPQKQFVVLTSLEGDQLRLAKIRGQLPKELVETYLAYKEATKAAGTYGIKFVEQNLDPDTGRIHVVFHQVITSTGRLSSEPNLQNIPRDPRYRACFKARPGYKFLIRDYSQIEPRLSAETSQDPVYLQTFIDGADIYCRVGEAMTGHPIDKKTHDGAIQRQIFKALCLALAYNMGPGKLCDALTLALEEHIESGKVELPTIEMARDLHRRYFDTHRGIKTYQDLCIAYANPEAPTRPKIWDRYRNDGVTYIAGPCGRKRWFDAGCKTTFTEAPNAPIQGCSATITKLATVLFWREARRRGIEVHFVNYVHDELIVEVPEAHADELSIVLKDTMEEAAARYIKTVPVKAEAPLGNGVFDEWYKEG